jgi:hypothetical protein
MAAKELGDLDGVGDPPVEGHLPAAGLAGAPEGLARPAVVPLDDGEVLFPGSQGQGEDRVGPARPAVQDQQHGIVAILTPELEPLVDPADRDEALLDDPIRGVDHEGLGHPALARRAPDQPTDRRRGDDAGRASQSFADHGCSQGPQRCLVLSGGSKRGPLQGLCPEPGSFPGLAWLGDGLGILSRAVESIGSQLGLPRFDGQGWWLGQATCLTTSSRAVVSNSLGVR